MSQDKPRVGTITHASGKPVGLSGRKLVSISDLEYLWGLVKSSRLELETGNILRCDRFLHSAQMWLEDALPAIPKEAD